MVKNLSVKHNRMYCKTLQHWALILLNYDLPMIVAALRGDTNQIKQPKQLSDTKLPNIKF